MIKRKQSGFSMVELMVGMVIALIATIVIFQVFAVSEERKRRTTSQSDATQNGLIAQFQLTRMIEGAGGGIVEAPYTIGCPMAITRSGSALSPAATLPAPFAGMAATFATARAVPFVAVQDAGDFDTFSIVAGNSTSANSSNALNLSTMDAAALFGSDKIKFANTQGMNTNDFLLAVETRGFTPSAAGTLVPCLLGQVTSAATVTPTATTTGFSGTAALSNPSKVVPNPVDFSTGGSVYNVANQFANTVVSPAPFSTGYSSNAFFVNLGDVPAINLVGVDNVNRLVVYDRLQRNGVVPESIADNIVAMKVLYGVAGGALVGTANNIVSSNVTAWVPPNGAYAAANLMAGTFGAMQTIATVKSVRVALVVRSSQIEKTAVSPASISLFSDVAAATYTRALSATERQYRYQVVDFTVPLRNMRCNFQVLRGCVHDTN